MTKKPTNRDADPVTRSLNRRGFLKTAGAGAAVGALPFTLPANAWATAAQNDAEAATNGDTEANEPAGYLFFNVEEIPFIEAAVDVLIPHDDVGPGALELGVNTYIDRQMHGAYGRGYRLYLQGPFEQGTPEQGWQLALTPAQLIRLGIANVQTYAQDNHGSRFEDLSTEQQVAVFEAVETGQAILSDVPAQIFFNELLQLTVEGYFADPLYRGNKGKAAWDMLGFPGLPAMYRNKIAKYRNKPYQAQAKSIQDFI